MEFEKILSLPAKFVDIRVCEHISRRIIIEDGKTKEISLGKIYGIGIRVLDKIWGFASSNNASKAYEIAEKALKIAKSGEKDIKLGKTDLYKKKIEIKPKINPLDVELDEIKEILTEIEKEIKGKKVSSTSLSYGDSIIKTSYLSSEGSKIETKTFRTFASVTVFARENGYLQVASERLGGVGGIELIKKIREKAIEAKERAVRLLSAKSPPIGKFRVILDPKLTGVFIHEALGHAVEADHVLQKESILEDMLNKRVASPLVTIYDDPTIPKSFGFYFYDDEGVKAEKKIIIENGILKEFLHSRETAGALKSIPKGNARAQSYDCIPIPRMSNTYLAPKNFSFEELIEDINFGVYLKGSKGGEVDTARGVFQFSAEEGYIIERGEIKQQIRDVALSGSTLEILRNIDGVADDFEIHIGFCGKAGQYVPVGDGGPHIRTIATVGGINGYRKSS